MNREEQLLRADLNYVEALREQARHAGGEVVEGPGYVLTAGPLSHPVANSAVRTDAGLGGEEFIERVRRFYGERRHGYGIILHHSAADGDVLRAAQAAGLMAMLTPPEMIVEHRLEDRPLPAGTEIRRVSDGAGLRDFAQVAGEAWTTYGIPAEVPRALFSRPESVVAPHIAAVVAYLEGKPTSAALVLSSHGIAGIYWVSTTSAARGRGLGEACTRAVTNIGFDLGGRFVSLQASPMGEPIYRRMGYTEIGRYQLVLSPLPD